ncbi:protein DETOXIFICATION 24-like [Mercurialis annua]|uniref:protein DETOXIFICATION 24-like n=1 Tax=Mercurialis annua TaxID=3986 RepID=UPI00215E5FB5|nr:protein DETOXIFICATION 24-like [Mercurialis annua]
MEISKESHNSVSENVEIDNFKSRIWTESKQIWRIAFPGIVVGVTSFGMMVVTQLFIGHIGDVHLAAYALVQTVLIQLADGILVGMSSATETLCGQAYGAGQYHMMGIYLQRSWLVEVALGTIILPLFFCTAQILKLIGQDSDIANVAGRIALWFIPIVYSFIFILTMQKYLQAQMKNQIVGWISAVTFAVHVPLSWVLVSKLKLGVSAAMGALNISNWLTALGLFAYVFGGGCPQTWKGFTIAAFKDILPIVKLSISSGIMICLELWYMSTLVLLAGYMKNATVAISAFSICLNISGWQIMICFGFLGAACVRVSNELGAGNAKAAKFSIKIILCTSMSIGVISSILCLIFSRKISYLFTDSEEVADSVSDLSQLLAISLLFNSIQPVLTGVAVGAGLQSKVAYVNLACYYGIGIPVGALLGYVAHLKIKGLWIGMLIGVASQTLVLSFLIWTTDWDVQVNKASKRLHRLFVNPSKETREDKSSNTNA